MDKKVVVTGCAGQIGSYMCEYLLQHTNYQILGGIKANQRTSPNIKNFCNDRRFKFVPIELTDSDSIKSLIKNEKPDYFIHLAAKSSVSQCKEFSDVIANNTLSVGNILEFVEKYIPSCRVLIAGSEQEKNHYNNLYALSKYFSSRLCEYYRKRGIFCIQPMIYPSISERQSIHSFCNKIIHRAIQKKNLSNSGDANPIPVGNLHIKNDFSYCFDTARILWANLNLEQPIQLHIASGNIISNEDWIKEVFNYLNIKNYQTHIKIDEYLLRNGELDRVCDKSQLDFTKDTLKITNTYNIRDIIKIMVDKANP